MKEDFLHYIWQHKKFDLTQLKTIQGETLVIYHPGHYLQQEGPDFFNAQLEINNQKWAGNVEIHKKASDWYVHHHEKDKAYENVILHVVWEYDVPVYRVNNEEVPVLELRQYVSKSQITQYQKLMKNKSWINCEKYIADTDVFVFQNWLERLFLERLEQKSLPVLQWLSMSGNDWEFTLFCSLAKNFGLNTNGVAFEKMALSIPFSVVRKESCDLLQLEALFFGRIGLLEGEKEDNAYKDLKKRWQFLRQKHQLKPVYIDAVQFFKHRPDNFPTIRLAQLAQLYHSIPNLFSRIITAPDYKTIYQGLSVGVSNYWQTHYVFDKQSSFKNKTLSKSFINLLLINTILPVRYVYDKSLGKENIEFIIDVLRQIPAEKNVIIDKFMSFDIAVTSAFYSQALLQLKNNYCSQCKCLQCAVGIYYINKTA